MEKTYEKKHLNAITDALKKIFKRKNSIESRLEDIQQNITQIEKHLKNISDSVERRVIDIPVKPNMFFTGPTLMGSAKADSNTQLINNN